MFLALSPLFWNSSGLMTWSVELHFAKFAPETPEYPCKIRSRWCPLNGVTMSKCSFESQIWAVKALPSRCRGRQSECFKMALPRELCHWHWLERAPRCLSVCVGLPSSRADCCRRECPSVSCHLEGEWLADYF